MTASISAPKVLCAPADDDEVSRVARSLGDRGMAGPRRIAIDPQKVEHDLARLVLTVIELLRQVIEKQAMQRVDNGTLTDDEIERLGQALIAIENRMEDLKQVFGLQAKDLTLNLGPLGDLL